MAFLASVVPTQATNKVRNPSLEAASLTATWTAQTGVTFSVDTTVSNALFGLQSGRFQTTAQANTGIVGELDSACGSSIYYITFYVKGTGPASWRAGLHNSTSGVPAAAATATAVETVGLFTRYKVTVQAADANGMDKVWIGLPAGGSHTTDCYLDGVMVSTVDSTYLDGDLGFGYVWNGQRNAYSSTRYAWLGDKPVGGGVVNDLDTGDVAAGTGVFLTGITGVGLPPVKNSAQASAAGRGATYQATTIQARPLQLGIRIMGSTGTTLAALHAERDTFLAKLPIGRPFELRYTVASTVFSVMVVYEGGLPFSKTDFGGGAYWEDITLSLTAYDEPLWKLTYESRTALTFTLAQTFNYNIIRHSETGGWEVVNPGHYVYAYALGPDQTIWLGGESGSYQLTKWTGGTSVTNVAAASASGKVYAIAVSPDNTRVYVGGSFTTMGGTAGANIAYYTIASGTWSALGTGCNGIVYALKFDTDGNLWVGGAFTTANGTTVNGLCKYDGSAFSAVQAGLSGSNKTAYCLDIAPNGDVYIGGDFTGASQCSTPGAPTVTGAAGGSFTPTTQRYYEIVARAGTGETLPGSSGNATLGGGQSAFSLTWAAVTNATSYDIYRSSTGSGGPYYLIGSSTTNSFTDIGYSDQTKTTALIASNTTGARTTNVAKYRPGDSAYYSVGTVGLTGGVVYCNAVGRDGVTCYWGGAFTTGDSQTCSKVARYNGSVNLPMGVGMSGGTAVYALLQDSDGTVLAGGDFTSASGRTAAATLARWVGGDEGGEWVGVSISAWPAATTVRALARRYRDVWVGHNTTGSGTTAYNGTITYDGFEGRPQVVIVGPTSGTLTVRHFEIVGVGKLMLDLTVRAGETVTLDLDAGTIVSNYSSGAWGSERRERAILSGSSFSALYLRNGSNPYSLLASGTTTGASVTVIDRTAYLTSDT